MEESRGQEDEGSQANIQNNDPMSYILIFYKLQNKIHKEGKHGMETKRKNDSDHPSTSLCCEIHMEHGPTTQCLIENIAIEL